MAMAMLARALSLRRANQRAKFATRHTTGAGDISTEFGATETSPDTSAIHSSRVSQSIDALYVLSCLRDGLSLADTFASDNEDIPTSLACYRFSNEKLNVVSSSLSLSEHACSSDSWDQFSSSLSSSMSSDRVESSGKDALRCSNAEKSEDFCLVFNTDIDQLSSSSSPPAAAAAATDCCGFLISRKSNHSEDDLCWGFAKSDRRVGASADDTVLVQTRDNPSQKLGMQCRKSRFNPQEEGEQDVDDDLQSFLRREDAMKAVEKQSCNPYQDFRESMMEMMISACCSSHGRADIAAGADQKQISYRSNSVDEIMNIEDLLYCYLRLNAKELHELITKAFSDTCSDLLLMKTS